MGTLDRCSFWYYNSEQLHQPCCGHWKLTLFFCIEMGPLWGLCLSVSFVPLKEVFVLQVCWVAQGLYTWDCITSPCLEAWSVSPVSFLLQNSAVVLGTKSTELGSRCWGMR